MIKAPVNSKVLKALLCFSLVFVITTSIFVFSDANRVFSCGIQGKVVERQTISAVEHQTGNNEIPCPNIVLYVRDNATNKIITKVTCDDEGYFKVHLVPGRYVLEVAPTEINMQISGEPAMVDIEVGEYESVAVRVERKQTGYRPLPNQRFC